MNLKEAVGTLLSARIKDSTIDSATESGLREGTIGGVVLFKENASNLKQLVRLIEDIKSNSLHTLMISVDQEGGAVQRFDHLLTPLPSAMSLAAANDLQLFEQITKICIRELEILGFNCLLAPVLDVIRNPFNQVIATRSYSSNHQIVSNWALQYLTLLQKSNLIAVGKHFPGHGATQEDSHVELAVNSASSEEIWNYDLFPFKTCLSKLPAILTAHVWLPSIDKQPTPATLSPHIVRDILRDFFKYDGLVITDSFDMKAITDQWSVEEASLMALQAGADHLLLCLEAQRLQEVHKYLISAVNSGKLSEERLLSSINRTKRLFQVKNQPALKEDEKVCLLEQSINDSSEIVLDAALRGITLLKGAIPDITSGEWLVIKPNHSRYPMKLANYLNALAQATTGNSAKPKLRFVEYDYTLDPGSSEIEQIGKECAERNCIFLTFRSLINQGQFQLAYTIKDNAREHVQIACDLPYDLIGLTDWQNCLATYDPSDLAMRALARILLKEVEPRGTCPVDLNLKVHIR